MDTNANTLWLIKPHTCVEQEDKTIWSLAKRWAEEDIPTTEAFKEALIALYWLLLFWWISNNLCGPRSLLNIPFSLWAGQPISPSPMPSLQNTPFISHLYSYHWQFEGVEIWTTPNMKYENCPYPSQQYPSMSSASCTTAIHKHSAIHHGFTRKIWCFLLDHLPTGLLGPLHKSPLWIWLAFDKEETQRRLKISPLHVMKKQDDSSDLSQRWEESLHLWDKRGIIEMWQQTSR